MTATSTMAAFAPIVFPLTEPTARSQRRPPCTAESSLPLRLTEPPQGLIEALIEGNRLDARKETPEQAVVGLAMPHVAGTGVKVLHWHLPLERPTEQGNDLQQIRLGAKRQIDRPRRHPA